MIIMNLFLCVNEIGLVGFDISVLKTWLQLILTKNYINDNYTKCVLTNLHQTWHNARTA